jgi:transposase
MVLLNAQGHTPVQVALLVRCHPDTVRRVLKRYRAGGPDAMPHRPHLGQPPHYPPAWEAELVRVADLDPHEVGVDSALWGCRLLADYLAEVTGHRAGIETVRIVLHRAGFVCKRPRWVLTPRPRASRDGQKRLRVEALGAAAVSPLPPPPACLVPDATLAEDLLPEDLPGLPGLLGRADLYLQDEVACTRP